MGGLVGWDGYDVATRLLVNGYRTAGGELLAEVERLNILEAAQMEIESARRERKERLEKSKIDSESEIVQGDLEGFEIED